MFDIQTYLAAKSGKLLASPDMDMFSYLLGKSQASPTKTITGVPPFTFKSNGDNLVDWSISGAAGGVGDKTKNLIQLVNSPSTIRNVTFTPSRESGEVVVDGQNDGTNNSVFVCGTVTFTEDTFLYGSGCAAGGSSSSNYNLYGYDETTGERALKWDKTTTSERINSPSVSREIYCPAGHEMSLRILVFSGFNANNVVFKPMLRAADTDAEFIPYGYEIPVTCGGTTTDIFIGDSPLGADDTVSKTSTGVDIPTVNGSNTLTVDTTVQPSEMTITYHK